MANLLSKYHEKRDFDLTAEPKGRSGTKSGKKLKFVIQLHEATRTHYDLRLEWHGVMKSWAVTRGPSYNPADKRLAVRVEDHPMEYNKFEGVIPEKQYGAGSVMIWDEGVWIPDGDPEKMDKKGHISFHIEGSRMHGHWNLVRMNREGKRENWLLIKGKDDYALTGAKNENFLKKENTSAVTGRSMKEILAAGHGNTAKKSAKPEKKPATKKTAKKSTATPSALMKKYESPELATLVDDTPYGDDWVHEIKYDGYRLMAFMKGGSVTLRTRGGKDWTGKFQPLADAIGKLKADDAVLDLEACVLDENGRTSFSLLKEALSDETPEKIDGWVFDILHLDGEDLTGLPLLERKEKLAKLLKNAKSPLHYSDHFESAPDLLTKACKIGAEGLISKRRDSTYQHRRTKDWVKSKCGLEQEFVIGGFMPAKDYDKAVGALLLGYYKNKKFTYAGKIGTGFTRKLAKDIYNQLIKLKTDKSPFPVQIPRGRRGYVFVKPEMLCEISFLEWTPDGHIRHGSFKGLREDKNPKAVQEEIPLDVEEVEEKPKRKKNVSKKAAKSSGSLEIDGVTITHPEREVYPGTGITKGDVAEYYQSVAAHMLPYMKGRLISLLRCTDGMKGECFFQRNPMKGMGDHIKPKSVQHNGKKYEYIYVEDETGLLQLAQMSTFEFHGWQGKVKDNGKADQVIFDLDPDDAVPFEAVKLAAEDVRRRLKKRGLTSFARISGGKGIHIVAPIKAEHTLEKVKEFAREIAQEMQTDMPDVYVATMTKAKRKGKIFVDFFRNDFSATAIIPFSLRAREGAPIAWPVSWPDLEKIKSANAITLANVTPALIKKAAKITGVFQKTNQRLKI